MPILGDHPNRILYFTLKGTLMTVPIYIVLI